MSLSMCLCFCVYVLVSLCLCVCEPVPCDSVSFVFVCLCVCVCVCFCLCVCLGWLLCLFQSSLEPRSTYSVGDPYCADCMVWQTRRSFRWTAVRGLVNRCQKPPSRQPTTPEPPSVILPSPGSASFQRKLTGLPGYGGELGREVGPAWAIDGCCKPPAGEPEVAAVWV